MKNLRTGTTVETTYNTNVKLETAHIDKRDMTYSYKDGDLYYFMDPESYDMVPVNGHVIEDDMKFVKENEVCKLMSHNGDVFAIEPPINVVLEVTECEPGVAGNTATNAEIALYDALERKTFAKNKEIMEQKKLTKE